jgi:hypothetical protein
MTAVPTNWKAMAKAAMILRDFTHADDSALEIIALHLEAVNATPLDMIDVIDRLTEEKPHLLHWSGEAEPATTESKAAIPASNPWKGNNLTEQMKLMRSDPELAQRLKAEAGADRKH